jgi:hypothetical protein
MHLIFVPMPHPVFDRFAADADNAGGLGHAIFNCHLAERQSILPSSTTWQLSAVIAIDALPTGNGKFGIPSPQQLVANLPSKQYIGHSPARLLTHHGFKHHAQKQPIAKQHKCQSASWFTVISTCNILKLAVAAILLAVALAPHAVLYAAEPNESFPASTVLPAGVLIVSDNLTFNPSVDTVMSARDLFGEIYLSDDDDSPYGDGRASALYGTETNSGSIDLSISGYPDYALDGNHEESGDYEVFFDVYDFFGDLTASFSEVRRLEVGEVHDFFFSDANWIGGTYDAYIDNTVSTPPSDVDFFTFTGLSPGSPFAARTFDPDEVGIDTYLAWFDSDGTLITLDDDGAGGVLSKVTGTVPADGTLMFAVSGYGDETFEGLHRSEGRYDLVLQLVGLPGDYNSSGAVDAADYTVWRDRLGSDFDLNGNGNETGGSAGLVDEADYATWKSNFEAAGSASLSANVPEPSTLLLSLAAFSLFAIRRRRTPAYFRPALAARFSSRQHTTPTVPTAPHSPATSAETSD